MACCQVQPGKDRIKGSEALQCSNRLLILARIEQNGAELHLPVLRMMRVEAHCLAYDLHTLHGAPGVTQALTAIIKHIRVIRIQLDGSLVFRDGSVMLSAVQVVTSQSPMSPGF